MSCKYLKNSSFLGLPQEFIPSDADYIDTEPLPDFSQSRQPPPRQPQFTSPNQAPRQPQIQAPRQPQIQAPRQPQIQAPRKPQIQAPRVQEKHRLSAPNPRPGEFQCPIDEDGFFADPIQCDKYYECVNGVAYQLLCDDGLVYDISKGGAGHADPCDSPYVVDCTDRPELRE